MNNTLKQHARTLRLSGLLESLELRLQEAEANRLRFGRTKSERTREELRIERASDLLDQHRLDDEDAS